MMNRKRQQAIEVRGTIFRRRRENAVNKLKSEGIIRDKRQIVSLKTQPAKNKTSFPTFVAIVKSKKRRS